MKGNQSATRRRSSASSARFLRASGLWLICVLILLLINFLGCHSHQSDVVGTWSWGDRTIRFASDGHFRTFETHGSTQDEGIPGTWKIGGDSVTLQFFNFEPKEQAGGMWTPDEHFTLSADGQKLTGTESDSGTMIKLKEQPTAVK